MEPIEEGEEHAPLVPPSVSSRSGEMEEMLTTLQYSEETEGRSEVVVSRESPIRRRVIGATANGLAPAADIFREGGEGE